MGGSTLGYKLFGKELKFGGAVWNNSLKNKFIIPSLGNLSLRKRIKATMQ